MPADIEVTSKIRFVSLRRILIIAACLKNQILPDSASHRIAVFFLCFTAEKAPGTILNAIDMPRAFSLHLHLMVEAIDLKCLSKVIIYCSNYFYVVIFYRKNFQGVTYLPTWIVLNRKMCEHITQSILAHQDTNSYQVDINRYTIMARHML
jgi:hypothetical protein